MGEARLLQRFWFMFATETFAQFTTNARMGVGITAFDYSDALKLLSNSSLLDGRVVPTHQVIENIDISALDKSHVLPNMKPPNARGIWFPLL